MDVQFSWLSFLKNHGIRYVETGSNVAPNHVNIRCPFCVDDPSEHMGLSLNEKHPYYACWRNTSHRGKYPAKVIAALLKLNYTAAEQLVKTSNHLYADDMMLEVDKLAADPQQQLLQRQTITPIIFDKSIKPLVDGFYAQHFYNYLLKRKFPNPEKVARKFDLHYSVSGKWAWRIVFPVVVVGKLVSYIGRDISSKSKFRYKNLSNKDSAIPIRECLLFEDELQEGGQALYITEGPFDALKLMAYLPSSHRATCCFGIPTYRQITKLAKIAPKFRKVVLVLDTDMAMQMVALVEELAVYAVVIKTPALPFGVKDPADLTPSGVVNFARNGLTHLNPLTKSWPAHRLAVA